MPEPRRFAMPDFLCLLLVIVFAAGLRVAYLVSEADAARKDPPARVQDASPRLDLPGRPHETESLVQNLKEYSWFGTLAPFADREEQTANVAPGLPWLLGTLAKLLPDQEGFERTVRWSNAGLGTLTAGLYFLFARRVFRSLVVGTMTGLLCAVYPLWVVNTGAYDDGALTSFLLGFVLFLGVRAVQTGGPFASLLFGLTLAGLTLVRAALLAFSFAALIWFLWRSRSLPRGWLCGLLAFLGFANGLAPWTVRNFQLYGEPMPIVDSPYLELWIGNNPEATGGPMTPAMLAHAPLDVLRDAKGQPLPQPLRYARLARPVMDEIRGHPIRTIQRRLRAGLDFFFGERFFAQGELVGGTPDRWLLLLVFGAILLLFPLSLLGWRWTYPWHRESLLATLAVIWIPLPYLLGHAEGLHGPRLPLDGVLLMYAAFAVCSLVPKIGERLADPKLVEADE